MIIVHRFLNVFVVITVYHDYKRLVKIETCWMGNYYQRLQWILFSFSPRCTFTIYILVILLLVLCTSCIYISMLHDMWSNCYYYCIYTQIYITRVNEFHWCLSQFSTTVQEILCRSFSSHAATTIKIHEVLIIVMSEVKPFDMEYSFETKLMGL